MTGVAAAPMPAGVSGVGQPSPGRVRDPLHASPVRAYGAHAGAAFKSLIAYRMQFLLGLLGSIFALLSLLYLWRTILAGDRSLAGFDWQQMKAYLLVAFLSTTVVSMYADYRMAYRIREGLVAIDLTKPIDYQSARFAETVGFAIFEVGAGLVVAGMALLVFGGITLPPLPMLAMFVLSMAVVIPLKFALTYCTALLCFWTQNYMGINWARMALMQLFSGALVPIALMPVWLRWPAEVLPFQGMVSTPALIFLNRLHGADLWWAMVVQLGWTVAFWYGARLFWRTALKRLTVQGG